MCIFAYIGKKVGVGIIFKGVIYKKKNLKKKKEKKKKLPLEYVML